VVTQSGALCDEAGRVVLFGMQVAAATRRFQFALQVKQARIWVK
jgi:hypothetical protein